MIQLHSRTLRETQHALKPESGSLHRIVRSDVFTFSMFSSLCFSSFTPAYSFHDSLELRRDPKGLPSLPLFDVVGSCCHPTVFIPGCFSLRVAAQCRVLLNCKQRLLEAVESLQPNGACVCVSVCVLQPPVCLV